MVGGELLTRDLFFLKRGRSGWPRQPPIDDGVTGDRG
jgi:hypothetical protein